MWEAALTRGGAGTKGRTHTHTTQHNTTQHNTTQHNTTHQGVQGSRTGVQLHARLVQLCAHSVQLHEQLGSGVSGVGQAAALVSTSVCTRTREEAGQTYCS